MTTSVQGKLPLSVELPDVVPDQSPAPAQVDGPAFVRLCGEPLFELPQDLCIPPDALEVFLEMFEGPLGLPLYLIRHQNFNVLDVPPTQITRQYPAYTEQIHATNPELAAEYLLMAAMLIEIESYMLLPVKKTDSGNEPEDPCTELVCHLPEYEQMKLAVQKLDTVSQLGRDSLRVQVCIEQGLAPCYPDINSDDLHVAWANALRRVKLTRHHKTLREELSVYEHMS